MGVVAEINVVGARVRKVVGTTASGRPAVRFELETDRTDAIDCQVTESIPHGVEEGEILFSDAEYWLIDGDRLILDRRLTAGDRIVTGFEIESDTAVLDHFDRPPRVAASVADYAEEPDPSVPLKLTGALEATSISD